MSEIELEEKINDILKEEISNDSLFIKNDFNNFYNNILIRLNISDINELIDNNFTDEEKEQYNEFYTSLESLYLIKYGISKVKEQNADVIAQTILSLDIDFEIYLSNEIKRLIGQELDELTYNLSGEHDDILNDIILSKIENFTKTINDSIFKLINNKQYLLNNVSNENFIYYLDNNKILTNMDINLLNLYLDNKRYNILSYISDDVFCNLSKEQLKGILSLKNIFDYISIFSNNKIQYIINLFDLKELIDIYGSDKLGPIYKKINYISEENLDYIINHNKLNGIEECKYVINNIDYVKRIIKSGYYDIFNYLSLNQIDDDILENIQVKGQYWNKNKENLKKLLMNNKIFLTFSQKVFDEINLLYIVGQENITREMVLFCMLNGMEKNNSLLFETIAEKVKMYYPRKLDNIKYALSCGYKCSSKTIQLTEEEMDLFIDYNQPEIIDYAIAKDVKLSKNIIKKAISKGHKYDHSFSRIIFSYDASGEFLKELLEISTTNNNYSFIDSFLLDESSQIELYSAILLRAYSKDLKIKEYLKFLNKCKNTIYFKHCKSKEEIYEYFNETGPTDKLYSLALLDSRYLELFIINYNIMDYYQNDKAIINYIKYVRATKDNLNLKSKNDIYEYFNETGPTDKLYSLALLDLKLLELFINDYNITDYYQNDKAIINYIKYFRTTKDNLNIKSKNDIYEYFNETGKPTREMVLSMLLNINTRNLLSIDNDFIQLLTPKEQSYLMFLKKFNFDNRICFNSSKINEFFDENGKPTREMVLSMLLNINTRNFVSIDSDFIQLLTPKEQSYLMFLKKLNFDNQFSFNSFEINEYFDENGLTDKGVEHILNDLDIIYNMDQQLFKSYYEKNFNISVLQDLLKIMDNNYYYLSKFLSSTLNIKLPIREDQIDYIKKLYCLDILNAEKMFEIIKYIFYSDEESRNELSKIISNNDLSILIKLFSKLSSNLNIEDLRKMVNNYDNFRELYFNLYNESEFNDNEKTILYSILINGNIGASKLIKNRDDLNNYSKIKYNKNNDMINTEDIMLIKSMIFSNLFNIDLIQVRKILDKYNEDLHFSLLKDNIHDDNLKNILNEYDAIIEFISSIFNSNDLDSLKIIAKKTNENYKDNNLDMFFNLWNNFSKMDSDIMRICGREINEKITIFSELLNAKEENIPLIDGEKAFIISNVNVGEDFEYDGLKINKGTNVQMIELNGLPFVSLGHVLNAYGTGGKLSDFNHPRLIGRTHLCLTGIDDNYYNLVNRIDSGIDYVQVLFDNLPSESLVIASSVDVGSSTHENSLSVQSVYPGTYQPIRKVITETKYVSNGYNEYVYHRQYSENMQSLRPSAILIRGENPTESEIQAAAYLNVPLVKINKEKYPIRTKEEMEQRDIELGDFYQKLYEFRKSKLVHDNLISLQNLRQQLMNYYVDDNSLGRRVG